MSEPKIAALKPAVLNLEPGTYYWCACGASGWTCRQVTLYSGGLD